MGRAAKAAPGVAGIETGESSGEPGLSGYSAKLETFLVGNLGPGRPSVPSVYHAVRNLAYASDGNRDPARVIDTKRGACTGKHLLLRDLLRHIGEKADVELVAGDFAAGMPQVASMPEALRAWISTGGIRDFHCYVVWTDAGREVKLDATWPDMMEPFGYAVNSGWDGKGDTRIALNPDGIKVRDEDVIARKEALLATLSDQQRRDRREFLDLLTGWMPVALQGRKHASG
jgi:hypothetical protein